MILNHKIHVLTKKEELDTVRLADKVAVVLDVLFATSTMVTALAHGATAVVPALDEAAARAAAARHAPGSFVMAGGAFGATRQGVYPPHAARPGRARTRRTRAHLLDHQRHRGDERLRRSLRRLLRRAAEWARAGRAAGHGAPGPGGAGRLRRARAQH